MTRARLTGAGVLLGLLVLAVDQASKWWVLNVLQLPQRGSIAVMPGLNLTMEMNSGVTFGLLRGFGSGQHIVLALVALAVVVALGAWLRRAEHLSVALALGAVAGGAVGNVVDRLRYGEVVDFIHVHAFGWSWYIFNLADSAIVCGVAVLVLDGLLPRRRAILKPEPRSGNPA
jgi:signal peptidase II